MIELIEGHKPFVAFVGSGASALPPSRLPTWIEFNNLLLECLCERLSEYSNNRQPTNEILTLLQKRRDETKFFAPDFQAQLMEEEIGADYFRVWQSLETTVYGPVHAGLAELASRGRLAAIITTNFDRLIETALQERSQAFEVFPDSKSFEALATIGDDKHKALPVIKIHGSIEDADSLVDTLRQRIIGRPEPLMKGLKILLLKYPWLYLGFSGADFNHNMHYLGILDAAADAKGFVFLARQGTKLQKGMKRIAKAYGAEKASIIYGDLSQWLCKSFNLSAAEFPSTDDIASENDAVLRIKNGIRDWVGGLGPMAVVNILCSMLKSSGMEAQALWLLRKTWKSYRSPDDTKSKSYHRYNYNYGMSLLETGFIRNPVSLADDMNNVLDWREHADQNACEFFARSYDSGNLLAAGAQLAAARAYRGEVGKAIALTAKVTEEALTKDSKMDICDVAIASATIYDIVRFFDPAVMQLQRGLKIAEELGDEIRRSTLCVHLGRFLTYAGHIDEAESFLNEAERIGRVFDLQPILLASQAARGRWFCDSGKSDKEALRILHDVASVIHALDEEPIITKIDISRPESQPVIVNGHHPILCRVLLDLNRAALFAADAEIMNQTLDELEALTTGAFYGYYPHYALAHAECLLSHGTLEQRDTAATLIRSAREVGDKSQNPWVEQAAAHLEEEISKRS